MRLRLPADPSLRLLLLVGAWGLTRFLVTVVPLAGERLYPAQEDPYDLTIFQIWAGAFTGDGGGVPLRDQPWEYPAGAALLIAGPALLRGAPYVVGFVGQMLLLDLALLLALAWWGTRHGTLRGAWFWVAAVPLLGPVVLGRFDLAPTLLAVGGAMAAAAGAPFTAGALLVTGGWVKLWPALLVPLVLALHRGAVRVVAGGAAVGLLGLAAVARFADLGQVLSFVTYQQDRGLEIESVPALPLMIARLSGRQDVSVSFAFGSFQVDGPGAGTLLLVADLGLLVVLLGVGALAWRARVRRADPAQAVVVLAVTLLVGVLLTDKVLSAQYPVWVAGLVALSLCRRDSPLAGTVLPLSAALVLTQLVYPGTFADLVAGADRPVWLLLTRDLLLLAVLLQSLHAAWRLDSSEDRVAADEQRGEQPHQRGGGAQDEVVRAPAVGEAGQRPQHREDHEVDPRQ